MVRSLIEEFPSTEAGKRYNHLFAEPIIERLLGRPARPFRRFPRRGAVLSRNLPSVSGREEYVRVRVHEDANAAGGDDQTVAPALAEPLFGKSGLIRTLTQGHGLVRLPAHSEGLDEGATVEVLLFPT